MARPAGHRLFIKKSVDQVQREAAGGHLKRSLGPVNLVLFGIGCIIGAGIYVMTGNAAANYAGPAVMLSFVIAGFACVFAGLCYAELASTMPVAGSAYTYSYTTLGEMFAWIMGWLLVLEYGVSAAVVAAGWSGNVVILLEHYGIHIPPQFTTPFVQAINHGGPLIFSAGHGLNLIAAGGILAVTCLLVLGVSESARVNNVVVAIKVGILLTFIVYGLGFIKIANYHPFIPANEGHFGVYGVSGIFRAASVIFFAYVGFEAVSTAAGEAKNPQRDMPIGILGSLIVCTVIYILTAAVLTGVAPFRELGVAAPIAFAAEKYIGIPWFSLLVTIGTIAGLSSVMLILTYGQSRVFFSMARDGLVPRAFARLHPKFRTPWIGTIILGVIIAIVSSLLPITILGDLVSLGTATAFAIVCISVLWLRKSRPDLPRPFRVPGGAVIPVLGVIMSAVMALPLLIDIVLKFTHGDRIPAYILGGYLLVGAAIYLFYGLWNSRLAKGLDIIDDGILPGAMEVQAHGLDERPS
jgi:APA family basic amino acid/polyamine antiporter